MKTELLEKTHNPERNFAEICLDSCRKLLDRIAKVKEAVLGEFHDTVDAHNKMLRLALNEAEALAWETDYPHLVFPALALEKAEEVTSWEARQREVVGRFSPNNSPSYLAPAFSTR